MEAITNYFNAEKNESLLFILVGITTISLGLYFLLKLKTAFFCGMAYPLIAVAVIQITVGAIVYFRSPADIKRVSEMIQSDKTRIQSEEIPRMRVVMKNFVLYRNIELALILIGVALYFYFPASTLFRGLGLGLFLQAAFMLGLDYFAESRGKVYLEFLQSVS